MSAKNTSASLHRIMRLTFTLAFFYLGLPFTTYCIFKSANAMEVTFFSQLNLFSYSFAIQIPFALVMTALQMFTRMKYFLLLALMGLQGYFIYKGSHEARAKHFDFNANKQMAWTMLGAGFLYAWVFKSYFL